MLEVVGVELLLLLLEDTANWDELVTVSSEELVAVESLSTLILVSSQLLTKAVEEVVSVVDEEASIFWSLADFSLLPDLLFSSSSSQLIA